MRKFKSSLIASIGALRMMMTLTAFTLLLTVFGGQAHGESIFVDAGANPGGDGSAAAPYRTITDAIAQAREIRQRKLHSKINVHVAPGVYSEAFPIYLNISKLSLRGSTQLIEDDSGLPQDCGPGAPALPAPCVEAGTETLITPLSPLQTIFDPALHPDQVPDKLRIEVIENDFSRNATFGFRFESYVSGNLFYDTTDNQSMTANITAVIGDNSFTSNGEYGLTVEGAFATRSNPRDFTATFTGRFHDNDL